MVEEYRDAAIAQLNHALSTLTAAVDIETVRHHLDYVKTRLNQYIHTAEAVLEFKDGQLVAKEKEINALKNTIKDLEKENLALKEKQNSLPGENLRPPVSQWCATSYANRD
jgi:predicted nuclease with TOPRIM domain